MKKIWVIFFLLVGCSREKGVYHPLRWEVGQWVSYKINGEPIRVSIVGDEGGLFWLETVEPEIIVKVLIGEGSPSSTGSLGEARRLIVKRVDEEALEFQVDRFSIKSGFPKITFHPDKVGMKDELFTLPCGKFRVVRIEEDGVDVWLSSRVPIFGIVKYKSNTQDIVLCDYGLKGAKSELKGEAKVVSLEGAS